MIPVKSAKELETMRRANQISAGALAAGGAAVKSGATTEDVDKAIYEYIIGQGARPNFKGYNGFPGSACVSLNDGVIHGIPSKSVIIKDGDIVSIDTGAVYKGFHGDNAYTFTCGEVDEKAKELLDVTKDSLYKGIEAAQAGNRIGDVGHAIQSYVEGFGFSVVRTFVGHGIGREMHEPPEVPNFGAAGHGIRLVPGMTIAIEPMINEKGCDVFIEPDGWTVRTKDGGLSAHFEHTVLITKDGPCILTGDSELWTS